MRVSANGEAGTSRSKGSKASDTNGAPMPESTPHQAFKVAAAAKIRWDGVLGSRHRDQMIAHAVPMLPKQHIWY